MRYILNVTVAAAAVTVAASAFAAKSTAKYEAPLASPPGVTFQTITVGEGVTIPGSSSSRAGSQEVFADSKGLTLYYSDKDQPGKSLCAADCLNTWKPYVPAADAKDMGQWKIISRDDGTKQWAYNNRPLYTNVGDQKFGDSKGNDAEGKTWHAASLNAAEGMPIPLGIKVQEVADANGHALTDEKGMPLYAFAGDLKKGEPSCGEAPCLHKWKPFAAPLLAVAIGDFTVINRADGVRQWAFKGEPLYTWSADVEIGDARGRTVDKNMSVAMLARFFMPANVAVRSNPQHGGFLTTAEGMSLYARDTTKYMGLGNHAARGGAKAEPKVGTAIGTTGCVDKCLEKWKPLEAPADAQPWGNWTVMTRPDGGKQWAYLGYAMYTSTADKKPGDINGHDEIDMVIVNEDTTKLAPAAFRYGLYWRVATQ
jgi:predicted lipoprotein with Yx(FWY)xxD motif